MVTIGYFLSSEDHDSVDLVDAAVHAEQAGFSAAWISDHFHPWLDEQGQSPFVWSVLGGIARTTRNLRVCTAVTCPIMRIHPAVIAQAAATTQQLFGGRFSLGVGSGEWLNEHILGGHWPIPEQRLDMLEEAVALIRRLWTGEMVDHHGRHYTVENARIYTRPESPPPVLVSAFGPKAIRLAASIGDGYILTMPNADMVRQYRQHGGTGPVQGGLKVCWNDDEDKAVEIAHRTWRHELAGGQIAQDLATPDHFAEVAALVTPDMVREKIACGPDPERHVQAVREYVDAGFDEVYVSQMGPGQHGMIDFYAREVLPRLR